MIFILLVLLLIICISLYFIKKKAGKIIFFIAILALISLVIFVYRYNVIFFFSSIKYEKYNNYDYSQDINQYGHITEDGAINIAKAQKRISEVNCKLMEYNELSETERSDLEDIMNSKNVTKYYSISFITGWDKSCRHWTVHDIFIDYYTGDVLMHLETD